MIPENIGSKVGKWGRKGKAVMEGTILSSGQPELDLLGNSLRVSAQHAPQSCPTLKERELGFLSFNFHLFLAKGCCKSMGIHFLALTAFYIWMVGPPTIQVNP